MSLDTYYKPGDWNAICYECGFQFKASQLKKHWQGFYVCNRCWEPRQPQDFVRAMPDNQTPPWVQPVPAYVFIDNSDTCTPQGLSAVPGESQPGCMTPGYLSPFYIDDYFTP